MRVAVLSDIHGNLVALERVLAHAGAVDALWCLGDIVGYGPRPNEVIALLQEQHALAIAGNHDWAVLDRMDINAFNRDAARAARWTAQTLSAEALAFLETLEPRLEHDDFTLVHGSPRDPFWEYLLSLEQAHENLAHFSTRVCLFGHTHLPSVFVSDDDGHLQGKLVEGSTSLDLSRIPGRFFLNPGSVGQPRDGDPRAAYLLLDLDAGTVSWSRVPYAIEQTQAQMRAASLPQRLIQRLAFGR